MAEEKPDTRRSKTPFQRSLSYVSMHRKALAAVGAGTVAVIGVLPVFFSTPILDNESQERSSSSAVQSVPQLVVADFIAGRATRRYDARYSGEETPFDTGEREVARVQIGLRNTGPAPAFITGAVFSVKAYETLESCVHFGEPIAVTESVDVELPYKITQLPLVIEEPLSFQVKPNSLDRLEFTFSVPETPISVAPSVGSVDIFLVQDTTAEPLVAGTAKLVLPATNQAVALDAVSPDPLARPDVACNRENADRIQSVARSEVLERASRSPEFDTLLAAYDEYQQGNLYEP